MSIENFFENLLDKSAAMRALRKSAGKAIVLGLIDALQAPGNVVELEGGELNGEAGELKQVSGKEQPGPAVSLPRPQLIGIAARQDEPDKPGVPPKRVRKKPERGEGTERSEGIGEVPPPSAAARKAEGENP